MPSAPTISVTLSPHGADRHRERSVRQAPEQLPQRRLGRRKQPRGGRIPRDRRGDGGEGGIEGARQADGMLGAEGAGQHDPVDRAGVAPHRLQRQVRPVAEAEQADPRGTERAPQVVHVVGHRRHRVGARVHPARPPAPSAVAQQRAVLARERGVVEEHVGGGSAGRRRAVDRGRREAQAALVEQDHVAGGAESIEEAPVDRNARHHRRGYPRSSHQEDDGRARGRRAAPEPQEGEVNPPRAVGRRRERGVRRAVLGHPDPPQLHRVLHPVEAAHAVGLEPSRRLRSQRTGEHERQRERQQAQTEPARTEGAHDCFRG
jgi:hypothetical protein